MAYGFSVIRVCFGIQGVVGLRERGGMMDVIFDAMQYCGKCMILARSMWKQFDLIMRFLVEIVCVDGRVSFGACFCVCLGGRLSVRCLCWRV